MIRRTGAFVACVFLSFVTSATAQTIVGPGTVIISGVPMDGTDPATSPTGTGRIKGRVVDAQTGASLRDTMIRLTGARLSRTVGTDDEGLFEIENLPAGRFNLVALKPGYMQIEYGQRRPFESGRPVELADRQTLEDVNFAVPKGGVIVARVIDDSGDPVSNVRVIAQRYRFAGAGRQLVQVNQNYTGTDDRGEVRLYGLPPGEYYVSATAPPAGSSASLVADGGRAYVATYYPGTPSVDAAERVNVQLGREVAVAFGLVAARRVRVSGTVRRGDGSPAARVTVFVAPRTGPGAVTPIQTQPDGTFTVSNVVPGDYSVQASASSSPTDREQGSTPITVADADVTGVVVTLAKGGNVRGRVSFDAPPANVSITTVQPYLTTAPVFVGNGPNVQDDGSFVVPNVFQPGFVRVQSLPAGWFMKSVTRNGRDVTDVALGPDNGADLTGVEVVLTRTRAEIAGSVTDDNSSLVVDYTLVLFPEDRALMTPASRFIVTARPDQQGRFKLTGLPPARYLAIALDYIETGSERDPELLDRLRPRATPVTLAEGDAKMLTLPLVVQ